MPYFYLKTGPAHPRIYRITFVLPYQTHLRAENALFLLKQREEAGTRNPSKNPKKHLKKPLPPVRCTADGREEGGWLGWLGWAGWVTAEAGLAGLAGLG